MDISELYEGVLALQHIFTLQSKNVTAEAAEYTLLIHGLTSE
jgi:hypothetical protein